MSRLLHLTVSSQLNHDCEETIKACKIINDMTEEEEIIMARKLNMMPVSMLKSIDKMDEV